MFERARTQTTRIGTRPIVSDPSTARTIELLGEAFTSGNVTFSRGQTKSMMKFYGFHEEKDHDDAQVQRLFEAAMVRSLAREATTDGLRIMAVIARHLEDGQDPVKFVVQLMIEAGIDMPGLYEWAYDEEVREEGEDVREN